MTRKSTLLTFALATRVALPVRGLRAAAAPLVLPGAAAVCLYRM